MKTDDSHSTFYLSISIQMNKSDELYEIRQAYYRHGSFHSEAQLSNKHIEKFQNQLQLLNLFVPRQALHLGRGSQKLTRMHSKLP